MMRVSNCVYSHWCVVPRALVCPAIRILWCLSVSESIRLGAVLVILPVGIIRYLGKSYLGESRVFIWASGFRGAYSPSCPWGPRQELRQVVRLSPCFCSQGAGHWERSCSPSLFLLIQSGSAGLGGSSHLHLIKLTITAQACPEAGSLCSWILSS